MSSSEIPSIKELRDRIADLLIHKKLDDSCFLEILDYSIEMSERQNSNQRYYGYHNTSHELVVTFNTLLAASDKEFSDEISDDDFKHLFAASVFHDYEPDKTHDKPHEELAANFVTSDRKLLGLFKEGKIDAHIVAALILRTSFPWEQHKETMRPKIEYHFSQSKYSKDEKMQVHYKKLGWFISVADRIGAYALGNFLDAMELAKKNAHSLGWAPQYIVRRSVVYFEKLLDDEREMSDRVICAMPRSMRKTFMDNVLGFLKLREKELEIRASIVYHNLKLVANLEEKKISDEVASKLFDIYDELPDPIQFKKKTFFESLNDPKTILVTLRIKEKDGEIIGFAKGGPLESYALPSIIKDNNYGKSNTIFLEPLALKMGYWGRGGGPQMRKIFRDAAKKSDYSFLTSFQLRDVIQNRINRNEPVEFVKKINPERLDYYRVKL